MGVGGGGGGGGSEDMKLREAAELAMRGCGGLLWLENNLHNYGTDKFLVLLKNACDDGRCGYIAVKKALEEKE